MQMTAKRDGVRLVYETAGDGVPVVLLPAWMITNRRVWAAQVAALAERFRVVSYDGRGSGESDRPLHDGAYEPIELVEDVLAVLDAAGVERAVLVGNSLGGLVGYLTAALHPSRVAGLALIGPTVDLSGEQPSALQEAAARFDEDPGPGASGWELYNRYSWERDFPRFVDWFVATALGPEGDAAARAEGRVQGLDATPEVLAASIARRRGADPARLRALTWRITAPVLVINGDRDEICPPAWSREIAALLTARHAELAGAGHCPHVTRPLEVAGLLTDFIGGL
ncbi:alpha/beta hydrolase [Actinoplanes sp. NPDC051861]|uniref:alpha/beta fold hydrolase n=1 Tax=Actinoplanes sp. NPDC051861 TaxID=3155170 RepID=UPI00342ABEBB